MSRKQLKSVKIFSDTHKEISKLSKASGTSIQDIFSYIVQNYIENGFELKVDDNKKILKINFIDEINKLLKEQEERIKKSFVERTNTSIGFIKTLDKKVESTRRDIIFKIDPDDDTISHPLEFHYDFVIKNLLMLLKINGVEEKDLAVKLKDITTRDELEFFINSYNSIVSKRIN